MRLEYLSFQAISEIWCFPYSCCRTLVRARRRGDFPGSGKSISGSLFCVKGSRDSKAKDWLHKGKVLAPLVHPT
jgi:hypothetical protein